MNDIRTALDQIRRSIVPDPEREAFERLERRKDRRGTQRRVTAALTAMVIAVASTAVLIRAFDQPDSVASNPSPVPAVEPHEIVTIPVGSQGQVSAITSGFESVWVAAYGVPGGKGIHGDAILRLDPATNQVIDTIPVVTAPPWETGGGGLATGFGSLWVAGQTRIGGHDQGLLLRIDPQTLKVDAEIPLAAYSSASDVAANDTAVWVVGTTGDASSITKIDPATNQVTGQISLRAQAVRRVIATNDEVIVGELEWAGGQGPCSVLASIDPADARLLAEQPRGACSGGGIFGWDGDVWVAGAEGFAKVDPATATAISPVTPYADGGFPRGDVAVGASGAWFGAYPGGNGEARDTLSRFDPADGRIDTYPLKVGWSAATVLGDTIWAMNWEGTVTRIDLSPVSDASTASVAPAASLLSPAPKPLDEYTLLGDCNVGIIRASHVGPDGLLTTLGPYAPTWLPSGFGLLFGFDGSGNGIENGRGAIWTDDHCRQVRLEFVPGAAGDESPRPAGQWQLLDGSSCTFSPLRDVHCLTYHAQDSGGVLNLTTVGLSDQDAERIVAGIPLRG